MLPLLIMVPFVKLATNSGWSCASTSVKRSKITKKHPTGNSHVQTTFWGYEVVSCSKSYNWYTHSLTRGASKLAFSYLTQGAPLKPKRLNKHISRWYGAPLSPSFPPSSQEGRKWFSVVIFGPLGGMAGQKWQYWKPFPARNAT